MSVYLEVAGQPVPIDDCSWYYYAPCGCCYGATLAMVDGGSRALVSEEDAWREFVSRADRRREKKAAGYRFEVGLRTDADKLLRVRCAAHEVRKS